MTPHFLTLFTDTLKPSAPASHFRTHSGPRVKKLPISPLLSLNVGKRAALFFYLRQIPLTRPESTNTLSGGADGRWREGISSAGWGGRAVRHRHRGGYTGSRLAAAELHSARHRSALTLHKLTPETEEPSEY